MGVEVIAPDGREWVVSRSIRWPSYHGDAGLDWIDVPSFDFGDGFEELRRGVTAEPEHALA